MALSAGVGLGALRKAFRRTVPLLFPLVSDRHVPELNKLVSTPGCQRFAIGSECYGIDCTCMPLEAAQFHPCRNVPQLHCSVTTSRGQHLSVRCYRYRKNPGFMPLESL